MKSIYLGNSTEVTWVDDEDYTFAMRYKWHLKQGRARRSLAPRDLSRYLLRTSGNVIIEYRNGNTLDNRRENLRVKSKDLTSPDI